MKSRAIRFVLLTLFALAAASCGDIVGVAPGSDTSGSENDSASGEADVVVSDVPVEPDLVIGQDALPTEDVPREDVPREDVPTVCGEPEELLCDGSCAPCPTDGATEFGCLEASCVALACEPGYALRGGACLGWVLSVPDQTGIVGFNVKIAIDSVGETHLVYNWNLASPPSPGVRWTHSLGASWSLEDVSDGGDFYVDFALDSTDRPHIVNNPMNSGFGLQYHTGPGDAGDWWSENYPQATVNPIEMTAAHIAVDATDTPRVILRDEGTGVARFYQILRDVPDEWSNWSASSIESNLSLLLPENNESLVIDGYDRSHVAYFDGLLGELRYAVQSTDSEDGWDKRTIAVGGALSPSLAVGTDNVPRVAYTIKNGDELLYATLGDAWDTQLVTETRTTEIVLALGPDDVPHIAFAGATDDGLRLQYATLDDGVWQISTVDPENPVGSLDIALDADGNPRIAYQDTSRNRVMLATF